ncbi:MAG: hypothetical protein EHM73_02345 [Chroococcales cyanobacterium metabat2.561]|uniref:Uncharacterized protein n=1 Tax=Microcystis aeruginosa Ma_SC_T_19800800_S464 TaxID=2486257 RepID=A0A552DSS1_MICAE|nr:MAG: hypothetical protein EHM73_02345 [Chroococcales cyanobacterium metabat2.561]TRU25254.1 MAG: hypothetical protein EWV81_12450 [Microcystis aeruginosa Ma_SC_T_19800800_S464]
MIDVFISRVCGKKFVGGVSSRSSGDRSQDIGAGRQESGDRRLFYLFPPHPTPHTLHPTPCLSLITDYCSLITDRGFHL